MLTETMMMTPAIVMSPFVLAGAFGGLLGAVVFVDGARSLGRRLLAAGFALLLLSPFVQL